MAALNSTEKRCAGCKIIKPLEDFYRYAKQKDGRGPYCKPCDKERVIRWQKANPDKKAASDNRQWQKPERKSAQKIRTQKYFAANKESELARLASWVKLNPDAPKKAAARYKQKYPQRVVAAQRKYHQNNETYRRNIRLRGQVAYALKREMDSTGTNTDNGNLITRLKWIEVLNAFGNVCCYCGSDGPLTIEHLTPLSRGGDNQVGNIAPACKSCNRKKWYKTLDEFSPNADKIRKLASLI
jgi:5-methylcytosine-specific restriction endonuclease McrA